MTTKTRLLGICLLGAGALAALPACSGSGSKGNLGTGDAGTGPLYAMMVQVYSQDDRTVYLALTDTVDVGAISLEDAREFPGVANFAAIDGRILVSSGSQTVITEFDITAGHTWNEGRSVSFLSYPLTDNANFYYQFVVDAHTALLPFDATKRIVWDPSAMAITGTLEDTTLVGKEPNLLLEAGGNRNSVHYDASVMQAFFYHDEDWYTYGTQSHIVVYDQTTQAEKSIVDVPCPGLSLATRDEQGNTYFGTWDLPSTSLLGTTPATCVARIAPDGTLAETIDMRQWTGGRVINNFRYVGNGKAFANVLHHEALGVTSPSQLDATALQNLWMSGPHWRLWLFDMVQRTAQPVEGIDVAISSGAQFAVLDGRTFVFLPYQDYGRTRIYELGADGRATSRIDVTGDVFKWVRVR